MEPILERLGLGAGVDPQRVIVIGALAAARVLPIFAIAPFAGGRLVPAPIRIAVSLAFVALLWPALHAATPDVARLGGAAFAGLILKELVIGAVLGFLVALPFWAAEAAGRLADTARGANLSEVLVPQTGTTTSPLGDLSLQLAIVVFFAVDGHLLFLRSLATSYEGLPLVGFPTSPTPAAVTDLAVDATSRMILAALGMAAPVLAALFLADVALGLLNRVSPSIGVYFVGMPAKAVLGILVFLLGLAGMIVLLRGEFIR